MDDSFRNPTGIFLYEDGTAGTMQQMDLAVHQLDLTS